MSFSVTSDLFPAWKWIDMMEQGGEIAAGEARLWKQGIYGLMVLWGLEPDEVTHTQKRMWRRMSNKENKEPQLYFNLFELGSAGLLVDQGLLLLDIPRSAYAEMGAEELGVVRVPV